MLFISLCLSNVGFFQPPSCNGCGQEFNKINISILNLISYQTVIFIVSARLHRPDLLLQYFLFLKKRLDEGFQRNIHRFTVPIHQAGGSFEVVYIYKYFPDKHFSLWLHWPEENQIKNKNISMLVFLSDTFLSLQGRKDGS